MKDYLTMTDAELEKSELFPYRCSEPTCTAEVGFTPRYCPDHWDKEAANGMTEYFKQNPFGNIPNLGAKGN